MPCRGAAPAAPAALRVAIPMPAQAWPRHWKGERPLVREERCRSRGKGTTAWAGLRRGFLPGWDPCPGPTPSRPSRNALDPNRTPPPEPRGPQLSPRVPGQSAPRASRTHSAPQRGTPSWTGDVAALWWAKARKGGQPQRGLAAAAERTARGRVGRLGLASESRPARVWEETQVSEMGVSDRSRGGGARQSGRRGPRSTAPWDHLWSSPSRHCRHL